MLKRNGSLRHLLEYIVASRSEMLNIVKLPEEEEEFPQMAPPASSEGIARAEAHLKTLFPPSYKMFLGVANGVLNFDTNLDLFSVEDFLGTDYSELCQEIHKIGKMISEPILLNGLIVGGRVGSRRIFLIDQTAKPGGDGELPVVFWSDIPLIEAPNFTQCLVRWCDVCDEVLATAQEQAKLAPPGQIIVRGPPKG